MIKKIAATAALALTVVATTALPASATGVTERVECLFRVYVNEGGEQGLDCLT